MIISFQHNYVFIRTKKTASTTVQDVLSQSLGPDDIVTKRSGDVPAGLVPNPSGVLHQHMTVEEIRPWLEPAFWDKAFKFTIERHPYEKAVSMAYYRFGKRQRKDYGPAADADFADRLEKTVRGGDYASFRYYTIDGRQAVDDFIRYENLHEDLKRIGAKLGISIPQELPGGKTGFRHDRRPASEILTDSQKEIVFEYCRPEFEFLGYKR